MVEEAYDRELDSLLPSTESRNMAMAAHLSAFAGWFVPLGNIAGPLIVWLWKGSESPFVDEQGKEALNFQISMTIYMAIAGLLVFVLIGFVLLPILAVIEIVVVILAAVHCNRGEAYRYPFCLRFVK